MGPLLDQLCRQAGTDSRQWLLRLRAAYVARSAELVQECRQVFAFLGVRVTAPSDGLVLLTTRSANLDEAVLLERQVTLDGKPVGVSELGVLDAWLDPGATSARDRESALQSLLDNLDGLFNSDPIESGMDLSAFPQVRSSVLNFGIALGAGRTVSEASARELENAVLTAIQRFEPRLDASSIRVSSVPRFGDATPGEIQLQVEGTLRRDLGGGMVRLLTSIDVVDGRTRNTIA